MSWPGVYRTTAVCEALQIRGFYPDFTNTSEKAANGPGEVLGENAGSTRRSSNGKLFLKGHNLVCSMSAVGS